MNYLAKMPKSLDFTGVFGFYFVEFVQFLSTYFSLCRTIQQKFVQ